eukprot:GEMP01060040.1.p1 GENE.GEMP01060040.1~~GEMP01060040.1.p1  ORF type:complete len:248 (+),score=44.70 GEMP01060040.1:264-1007(+)
MVASSWRSSVSVGAFTLPFSIMYFVRPSWESDTVRVVAYCMLIIGGIGTLALTADLIANKMYGKKTIHYYVERSFPKSLQRYIYDTLKNPYRWTSEHPWKNNGWKPNCVSLSRQCEGKYGRAVTMFDHVTNLEEVYTSGPDLCLYKDGNMYCVRKLESITDDRSRMVFDVVKKGADFPFESEKIVYTVNEMKNGNEEILKVGVHGEATINSRLNYFFNKHGHKQMETSILAYISTFDVPQVSRYSDG